MSLDVYLDTGTDRIGSYGPNHGLFSRNVTHNLGVMAGKAGIYQHLWRPEELEITHAKDLIEPLTKGLKKLKEDPEYYKGFNPENNWGDYDGFVDFVESYLNACIVWPFAEVNISR